MTATSDLSDFPHRPRRTWRAAGAVMAVLTLAAPQLATAQSGWVNPDVYELRDEVKKLSKEIAALRADGLAASPSAGPGAGADSPAVSGDVYVRLERLDAEVRRLIGAVEELDQSTRSAARQQSAKIAEFDFRISRLEAGKTGKHQGQIPGAGGPNGAPAAGQTGGGRLTPLQPENAGAGAPPTVLGSIRGRQPGEAAVARPIYDNPPSGGSGSSGSAATSSGGDRGLFDSAIASLQAGDWDSAEDQFQSFIRDNGADARAPDAQYFLGETYRIRGRFHDAVRTYAAGLKSHPRSKRAPDSWMRLGESLAQINQVGKACEAFKQVSLRFPDAPVKLLREAKKQSKRAGCR